MKTRQKTRQSMYSLFDESFKSLSVPHRLRKLLMLQDIADILLEGYKIWPKFMPIEKLMCHCSLAFFLLFEKILHSELTSVTRTPHCF